MLWDDLNQKKIGELIFKSQVKAIKMSYELIVVVLETRVYVYTISKLSLVDAF